jgi:ABC-2 type transport system permease protein
MTAAAELRTVWALMRRALNEIVRVPGAAIPGVLAPTIFMLGLTSVFGKLTLLPGFTTNDFMSFLIPVSLLQGAGFTGAATGVNLARDIELGWFDRLIVAPPTRASLLAGLVLSASMRALIPMTFLLIVGFSFGVRFPGLDGLLLSILLVAGFAAVAASWGITLALRF